jgi:hypothetical protein
MIQILILKGGIPTFVWEPQEAFSPVFYHYKVIQKVSKMTEKSKKIPKKPEKAQIFVWKPIH